MPVSKAFFSHDVVSDGDMEKIIDYLRDVYGKAEFSDDGKRVVMSVDDADDMGEVMLMLSDFMGRTGMNYAFPAFLNGFGEIRIYDRNGEAWVNEDGLAEAMLVFVEQECARICGKNAVERVLSRNPA